VDLARLIYTSTASAQCSDADVKRILEVSIRLNAINGVTGILYYSHQYFMQYLEGRQSEVVATYERLSGDNRHHSLRLVETSGISVREFDEWSMAYVPKSEILTPLHLEFMQGAEFNPHLISAQQAMELTLALRDLLPAAHYRDTGGEHNSVEGGKSAQ